MLLEHLRLENFRCLSQLEMDFPSGRILIEGNNAQGKTSLLEAIFYLVTGRSFRTRYDNDCVPWHAEPGTACAIRGRVRRAAGDTCRLAVTIAPGAKVVRIDDQPLNRLAALWGQLRAVLFTPDDLQLVKGGPGERRRYLDVALSQISPDFLFHLQRYNQALRQRNALLKRGDMDRRTLRENLAPWESQMAEHGIPIVQARMDLIAALEPRAARLYEKIAAGRANRADNVNPVDEVSRKASMDQVDQMAPVDEGNCSERVHDSAAPLALSTPSTLSTVSTGSTPSPSAEALRLTYTNSLRLEPPIAPDEARAHFRDLLAQSAEDDLRRGQTSIGPHRDDIGLSLSGKPVRDFGSQGQVRSCVLALRLAEVIEMETRTGEPPLVLLDDLASELDPTRKKRVLALLHPNWQTFLTTTRREDFPDAS
jgi:DNA replication and repair protein RecF